MSLCLAGRWGADLSVTPSEPRMCQCRCDRLHVDELGEQGAFVARLAYKCLDLLEARNGTRPGLPPGVTRLLALLLAAGGLPAGRFGNGRLLRPTGERVTVPEAARLLGTSTRTVRRWAAEGRFAGAHRAVHDWSLTLESVTDMRARRNRRAA